MRWEVPESEITAVEEKSQRGGVPAFVRTEEERRRWEVCVARACELIEELPTSQTVWYAALALYHGEIRPAEPVRSSLSSAY